MARPRMSVDAHGQGIGQEFDKYPRVGRIVLGEWLESVYSAMTSWNVGTIRGLESDVNSAMGEVRSNIQLIRYAADKPDWDSPSGRTRFNSGPGLDDPGRC